MVDLRLLRIFIKYVDSSSEWSGKVVAWLMLPLVLELVYDSIARYLFNSPTVWSYDVSYMFYAIIFLGGGAYTLLDEGHIRIELFYDMFSPKGRAIIDIIGYVVFFFPVIGALFYFGIEFTLESWKWLEHGHLSYWSPPIYHFKSLIPISAFLLLLQGVAKFIRAIATISKREDFLIER